MLAYAQQLYEKGYCVVPTNINPKEMREGLIKTLKSAPELHPRAFEPYEYTYRAHVTAKRADGTKFRTTEMRTKTSPGHVVAGGFGAFGLPSVDHSDWARHHRSLVHPVLFGLCSSLLDVAEQHGKLTARQRRSLKFEQIPDRAVWRRAGHRPTAEAWHRDHSPKADGALNSIFGGWFNCDDFPQYFSCIPGDYQFLSGDHSKSNNGFTLLSPAEKAALVGTQVEIPPGHLLVFFQNLLHEVVSTVLDHDLHRLHVACRLTSSDEPLGGGAELDRRLEEQEAFVIKSDERACLYPARWFASYHERLQTWSRRTFHPILIEERKRGPEFIRVVRRVLPSLAEAGLPLRRPYTESERGILWPHTSIQHNTTVRHLHRRRRKRKRKPEITVNTVKTTA